MLLILGVGAILRPSIYKKKVSPKKMAYAVELAALIEVQLMERGM